MIGKLQYSSLSVSRSESRRDFVIEFTLIGKQTMVKRSLISKLEHKSG
ncbi:MAG: hypothetical protein ACI89U_003247 [Gammaproteobacteria bacterium]|jgi:hypothetical protein